MRLLKAQAAFSVSAPTTHPISERTLGTRRKAVVQYIKMLSALAAEHVQRPRNVGPLDGATHVGVAGSPGDGPYVTMWLLVTKGRIERAAYQTHGCPGSVAAASMAAQLATGRSLEEARQITGEDILVVLGGLPEGKERFAGMAAESLAKAIQQGNQM